MCKGAKFAVNFSKSFCDISHVPTFQIGLRFRDYSCVQTVFQVSSMLYRIL